MGEKLTVQYLITSIILLKTTFGDDFCAGVVPDGTYEVCSRTTGQAAAGKFMIGITCFTYMS